MWFGMIICLRCFGFGVRARERERDGERETRRDTGLVCDELRNDDEWKRATRGNMYPACGNGAWGHGMDGEADGKKGESVCRCESVVERNERETRPMGKRDGE